MRRELEELRNRNKSKVKEADKITLPSLPEPHAFPDWRTRVANEFMAASGRGILAFQDILEVEDLSKTESDFAMVEPELESIYQKLGNALDKIISGNQLASSIRMKADEYRKSRLPMSGKLKLWMVHRYYQRSTHLAAVYAYEELRMVSYDPKRDGGGIKAMQAFYNDWVACINRAQAGVDPTARFDLFLQRIQIVLCSDFLLKD